jgi:predicted nuclease of restriction endonuclease-like RecB superfamily
MPTAVNAAMPTDIRLFDSSDGPWIGGVLDLVERSLGEPWRVLLERIEHAPFEVPRPHVGLIVGALRRVIGGRAERARVARKLRGLVLGHPALDRDAREARLTAAAAPLGISPREVEELLWADLANERPVTLPSGRPRETTLAAFANLDRVQRAIRRARQVRLCAWGDAHELVRTAARYGLLSRISRGLEGETVLEVTGPLAVFHATTVYGRALGALVPLLALHHHFTLDVDCEIGGRARMLHLEPPALLPPVSPPRWRTPNIAERLARDLAVAGVKAQREPPPIVTPGGELLFPDLVVDGAGVRWWIEILGFSTADYLDHKRASYRAAGIEHILLCIDGARAPRSHAPDSGALVFTRRVDAAAVLAAMGTDAAAEVQASAEEDAP